MGCLEGSGVPVLYIGRMVPKSLTKNRPVENSYTEFLSPLRDYIAPSIASNPWLKT
jgi:hypothetical protein